MFYVETQSDLAKEGSDRGTPEELVRKLANKFPDFSGSPNLHHATICTANLLGGDVPLRGQVVLPPGCQATVAGHVMAMLPQSPEAKAFLRWTQGEYEEEERKAAREWRASSVGCPTADLIEMLKSMGAYEERPCSTLSDVRLMTDEVMNRLHPDQRRMASLPIRRVELYANNASFLAKNAHFAAWHQEVRGLRRNSLFGEALLATNPDKGALAFCHSCSICAKPAIASFQLI